MDVDVVNHGSLVGFTLLSDAAREWAEENLPEDAPRMGPTIYVEHRYADDIRNGMEGDGLIVAC